MLRRVLWRSQLSGLVMALATGVLALSCGGGAERQTVSGPAPVAAVQPPTVSDDGGGSVGEAATTATTLICHLDATTGTKREMKVTLAALPAHLGHGDNIGKCVVAVCPCFTAANFAVSCPSGVSLLGDCNGADPYTLSLRCDDGAMTLQFEAHVDNDTVTSRTCWTFGSDGSFSEKPVTSAQASVCQQLIVGNLNYPGSCLK